MSIPVSAEAHNAKRSARLGCITSNRVREPSAGKTHQRPASGAAGQWLCTQNNNILHQLAEKGAKFKSLHDPWCDTSTPQGELLVTILAGFATFERHLIKERTDDGRRRAKARGVRFGRPAKMTLEQRREALDRLAKGETLVDVARTYGVDPTTIGRLHQ